MVFFNLHYQASSKLELSLNTGSRLSSWESELVRAYALRTAIACFRTQIQRLTGGAAL